MKISKIMVSLAVVVLFTGVLAAQSASGHWKYFLSNIDKDLFDRGVKEVESGKLSDAAATFEVALARKTLSFGPHFLLAGVYGQMDRPDATVAACKKILYRFPLDIRKLGNTSIKNPIYSQFYYTLGTAYLELNRYKEAADAFKKVLGSRNYKRTNSFNMKRFYPTSDFTAEAFYALTHFQLGIAYTSMGDRESAMKQYKILVKLDSEKAEKLLRAIKR